MVSLPLVFSFFFLHSRALAFSSHSSWTTVTSSIISRPSLVGYNNNNYAYKYNNAKIKRGAPTTTAAFLLYSSNNDNNNIDQEERPTNKDVNVAGVSVSPLGFLVLLQSNDEKKTVAFPIPLTSPPDSSSSYPNTNNSTIISSKGITMPELFQENMDQTSVTSPEALTFLQLLNGVDMATPILSPDTLSLICVWYAFLSEEWEELGDNDNNSDDDDDIIIEDELGLSSTSTEDEKKGGSNENNHNKSQAALDYIRAMVRTTLPPSSDGSYCLSYMDASPWQRARVKLPRAWLHGVRLQEMVDFSLSDSNDDNSDGGCAGDDSMDIIGRIPIQFILECSVDDGSKMLEIPLFAIPSLTICNQLFAIPSSSISLSQRRPTLQQQQLDISNEILQELSHNFNSETSASFMALALFHRYNKSGAGSAADSPVLKVSDGLLNQLEELQQKEVEHAKDGDGTMRYCWVVDDVATDKNDIDEDDSGINNDIDTVIQNNGLPFYRTLSQVQEEDQRVFQHLKQENFGKNPTTSGGGISNTDGSVGSNDSSTSDDNKNQQRKKTLTLEQQALQQRLKSAWKIAMQREDEGALEKIQKAMEDLEKEVIMETKNPDDAADEEETSLQKVQRAMLDDKSSQRMVKEEGEEEVVGLISELEEATTSRMEDNMDDTEDE
mmetsp:Transcript_30941/g.57286  ORF Transcript_30941/g.57286 Transcript_30941/m.57286 type:complete len:665 (-) Transcript_30941:91-2085(-)